MQKAPLRHVCILGAHHLRTVTVHVADKADEQQPDQAQAFVSNYTVKSGKDAAQNLNMWHLVQETRSPQNMRWQACICSHFALWTSC